MTSRQQDCLNQMRVIYTQFSGEEISLAIKIIRAEMTSEADRHALQVDLLVKQAALDKLTQNQ